MNRQDHLMEEHLNCVHWVIHSFIHVSPSVCGLEYDDLYQEGCIALWRTAETYDEQLGAQFHSYAISVIRNYLLDYCRKIQSRTAPVVSLEAGDMEMARSGTAGWDGDSSLFVEQVLEYGKRTYSGVAKLRLRFIRKTHCQKDFMLWRGSARLGGVSGVDFNILGNPAELVRKLKVNTDIAVFVNLDMVYQLNQNFAGQLLDVLIFCKSYQRGMLLVNAV